VSGVFEEIFGLPLHPLAVHAVLILLPIAVLATIAVVLNPRWRARYTLWVVALNAVAVFLTYLARESGKEFYAALGAPREARDHRELGLALIWFVLVFFALSVATWLLARQTSAGPLPTVSAAVTAIAAAVALYWVIRVGHSGTEAVWGFVDS
jgi:uncharacterized membrane protein